MFLRSVYPYKCIYTHTSVFFSSSLFFTAVYYRYTIFYLSISLMEGIYVISTLLLLYNVVISTPVYRSPQAHVGVFLYDIQTQRRGAGSEQAVFYVSLVACHVTLKVAIPKYTPSCSG